jgi:hypothetical protein
MAGTVSDDAVFFVVRIPDIKCVKFHNYFSKKGKVLRGASRIYINDLAIHEGTE